jgi:ATP-dependent Clp protease ATP-binding subunit ClpA
MEAKFSNRVKEVISLSREEAIRLGHDYIGTEHLLLGMIREGEGTAIAMIIPRGQPAAALNQPEKPDATDAAETPLSGLLKVKSRNS